MIESRIYNLFVKYYDKTISLEERDELYFWVLDNKNKSQLEDFLQVFFNKEFDKLNKIIIGIDTRVNLNQVF